MRYTINSIIVTSIIITLMNNSSTDVEVWVLKCATSESDVMVTEGEGSDTEINEVSIMVIIYYYRYYSIIIIIIIIIIVVIIPLLLLLLLLLLFHYYYYYPLLFHYYYYSVMNSSIMICNGSFPI